jgi:PhzF family phenazine biosynthesis protein
MTIPLYHVDAFTDRPFSGNPAAVCLLPNWKPDSWLQSVAFEMNLSETAYVVSNGAAYDLRWFTPKVEVDLCGHATLAAAHVLWHSDAAKSNSLSFQTRSGVLTAGRKGNEIVLDFPLDPVKPGPVPSAVVESLGIEPLFTGTGRFDFFIELAAEDELRRITPDFKRLAGVGGRGVIVTSRSQDPKFDFVSRFFAPAAGVDEDPATGSAHCCLVDFWSRRLGKNELLGYQASQRGGIIRVRVASDRALLSGRAVVVASSHWVGDI